MLTGQTIQKTADGQLLTKKLPLKFIQFTETEPSESYSPFLKRKIPQKPIPSTLHSTNQPNCSIHFDQSRSLQNYDCQVTSNAKLNQETYSQKFQDDLNMAFSLYTTSTVSFTDEPLQNGGGYLGGQEYLVRMKAYDSLGEQKFIEITQKLSESAHGLFWDFSKISESTMIYSPNSLLIPSNNFILQLKIESIKQANKFPHPLTLSINVKDSQFKQIRVESSLGDVQVEIDCSYISTYAQKQKQINELNFKVHEKLYLDSDLIKIKRLRVSMRKQNQQKTEADEELIEELKTQEGSKEYQKQIRSMGQTQIEKIVWKIEKNLTDLINDEYANYFIQSIFPLLSVQLKLTFLRKLKPAINKLIASSHGTFVFQSFLDYVQTQQHYTTILEGVLHQFVQLSIDSNASHFLRKLIETMPQGLLENFSGFTSENFLQLCNNRYGVCVLKNLYRRLVYHKSVSLRQYFFFIIKNNLESLAAGEYSNYLIQDIYNSYGEQQLHELSLQISRNPLSFMSTKYSIIILTKCIKQYWNCGSLYTQYLSENLDTQNIIWTRESKRLIQQIANLKQRKAGRSFQGHTSIASKKASRKYIST